MKTLIVPSLLALALAVTAVDTAAATDLHDLDYSQIESTEPVKSSYKPIVGYAAPTQADSMDIHAADYTAALTDEPVKTSYQVGKGYL